MPAVPKKPSLTFSENSQAKTMMWAGVIIIGVIIIFFWGWSIKLRISSFSWQATPESKLAQNSQEEWDKLFNNQQEKILKELAMSQMREALKKIASAAETGISSTSSASTGTPAAVLATSTTAASTTIITTTTNKTKNNK